MHSEINRNQKLPTFKSALAIAFAALFVVSVVYAATTIGSSITTAGNLTVTGTASTTSATSTAYIMVGGGFTLPSSFNYTDDLAVNGDAVIHGKATTTSLWIGGSGSGTATSSAAASGDLFIDNSLEVKNKAYIGGGTVSIYSSTSATTTKGLFVGQTAGTSTTTIGIGNQSVIGCLELTQRATPATTNATFWFCTIDPDSGTLTCHLGRCN